MRKDHLYFLDVLLTRRCVFKVEEIWTRAIVLLGIQVDSLLTKKPSGFSILEYTIYLVFSLSKLDLAEDTGPV